jgi:hypothetical protein
MKMKRMSLLFIVLFVFSNTLYASSLPDSKIPPDFYITVKNDTPFTCELIDAYPIYGHAPSSIIKPTLVSGDQTTFDILGFYPNVTRKPRHAIYVLSYACGSEKEGYKNISFSSNMTRGVLYYSVSGEIIHNQTSPGINAIIEDTTRPKLIPIGEGAYTSGKIRWSIK